MLDQATKDQFDTRLFAFARGEFDSEIESGFPILRTFPTGNGFWAKTFMERLPQVERYAVASALTKRWMLRAAELSGESMTDVDKKMVDLFLSSAEEGSTQSEWSIRNDILSRPGGRVRRRRFGEMLRQGLQPVFGNTALSIGPAAWRYHSVNRHWTVYTTVDIGGRFHELSYSHSIERQRFEWLREDISVLSMFGIAGQTSWSGLTETDCSDVVVCLSSLCRRFMERVPSLLESI